MQKLFMCIISLGVWSGLCAAPMPKALTSLKTVAMAFAEKAEKTAIDKALKDITAQFSSPLADNAALKKAVMSKTALFLKPVQRLAKAGKPVKVSGAVAKELGLTAGNVPAKDVLAAAQQLVKTLDSQLTAVAAVALTPEQEVGKALDSLYFLMRVATNEGKANIADSPLSKKLNLGKGAAASKKVLSFAKGFVARGKKAAQTLKAADVTVQLTQAQNDAATLRAQITELQGKVQTKQTELDTCNAARTSGDKTEALKQAQAAAEDLKKKVADLQAKIPTGAPTPPTGSVPPTAVTENAARIVELERQLADERTAVVTLQKELDDAQTKRDAAQEKEGASDVDINVESVKTGTASVTPVAPVDVVALQTKIDDLQRQVGEHQTCATELAEALAAAKTVQDEYEAAQEEWDAYEENRAEFADKMADLVTTVQEAQAQLETIEKDLKKE